MTYTSQDVYSISSDKAWTPIVEKLRRFSRTNAGSYGPERQGPFAVGDGRE